MKRTVKPGWFGSDDFPPSRGPVFSGEPSRQSSGGVEDSILTFHCNGWLLGILAMVCEIIPIYIYITG